MKFYLPDWNDRVDPGFDFVADSYTPGRDIADDVYAHELFSFPPYDGLLISRAAVEKSKGNFEELREKKAHKYFRLPETMDVFGDCGAFSYVNDDEPWYEVEDVLDYYDAVGVDFGVSVDHLVVPSLYKTEVVTENKLEGEVTREVRKKVLMTHEEKQRRVDLTLENALKFLDLHKKRKPDFEPIGVAQGWSPSVYASSTIGLIKMGYTYIAVGGLARSRPEEIMAILREINRKVNEQNNLDTTHLRFHLFGVANLNIVGELPALRVASIDSASYLRKAWLRSGTNYLTLNRDWYTAIRIPQSKNPRLKKHISQNGNSLVEIEALEQECLDLVNRINRSNTKSSFIDKVVDKIIEYDQYLVRDGEDGQSILNDAERSRSLYSKALYDQPWKRCKCEVCREIGVHVLIFRGTNRNKRRGFHNTWTFRRYMERQIKLHK